MNDLIKLLRGQRIDGRSTDEIMHFAANEIESLRSQLSYRIEERDDTNRNLTAALRREAAYKDRLAEAEKQLALEQGWNRQGKVRLAELEKGTFAAIENIHPRVAKLLRKGEPFFVVKASEPYAGQVVELIREHEGVKWTDEDQEWASAALAADQPRCFRCGHAQHSGGCVNTAPDRESAATDLQPAKGG